MISVHRLELRMVPKFCWLDLRLQESLYSMYGVPVSICDSGILNQSTCALIVFLPFPCSARRLYSSSNSSPQTSYSFLPVLSSNASLGQKRVQSPFSLTRFIKRSGIHKP